MQPATIRLSRLRQSPGPSEALHCLCECKQLHGHREGVCRRRTATFPMCALAEVRQRRSSKSHRVDNQLMQDLDVNRGFPTALLVYIRRARSECSACLITPANGPARSEGAGLPFAGPLLAEPYLPIREQQSCAFLCKIATFPHPDSRSFLGKIVTA